MKSAAKTPIPSLREALGYVLRLARLVRDYWSQMARGLALGLWLGVLGLITPYVSKLYFDNVYPARDYSLLHTLVIGIAVFGIASALMGAIRGYYTQVTTARINTAVGLMHFNHLQYLPMRFFEERRIGEIMSRLGDMRAALAAVTKMVQTLLVNGVYLLLVPPFLVLLNWKLALVALITTPITLSVTTVSSRISRRFMKQSAEAAAELNAIQVEALSQIRTVKSLAAEPATFRLAYRQSQVALAVQLRGAFTSAAIGVVNALVRAVGAGVFSWYAWTLILNGELSLGSFIAFTAYLGYLTGPVSQLTGLFSEFQQSTVALGRAFEYLDVEPEQDPVAAYQAAFDVVPNPFSSLALHNVTFAYVDGKPVLDDVSVEFPAGSMTAIIGESGSGKSTILRLLCRLERPASGHVSINGVDAQQIPLGTLRRQVGVVWQEPTMLRGTIWENLVFGAQDPSPDRVVDAVRACRLADVIDSLEGGYDTMVAEWGASLSGGQRQRFALARALVRDTPILLLDETTSQVDVQTEEEVLRELVVRLRGKTVILVTHRLATAGIADRICVLEKGRLVAQGSHSQLSVESAIYSRMIRASQLHEDHHKMRMMGLQ